MRIRRSTLLMVLVLVVAACGQPGSEDPTTTTAAAPEAIKLSYDLQAGTSYSYEVDIDQTIDMTASGDLSHWGEDMAQAGENASQSGQEEFPGEMSLQVNGTSTFSYSVADGPEPGTYAVSIIGDFSDLEFTGTIGGEPVSPEEIPDLAGIEPIETTVIVDEQGNVIPESSEGLGEDMFGALGGLGGLGAIEQLGAGSLGQFVGPPLSEEEVTVGDTWSETVEVPTLPGDDPIITVFESEVVGTDTVEGHEVFVIDTTATTSAFTFDLAELLLGFMSGFATDDASEEDLAELDALAAELRFAFTVDEAVADTSTSFDAESGLARVSETSSATHIVFDVNMPDEQTGELVEFAADMNVASDVAYRLVDSSST